jgi:alpha-D-ribose 1-methylphosphonate 5-triphosphate synthase subunit PhnL
MNTQKTHEAIVTRIAERRRVIARLDSYSPRPWSAAGQRRVNDARGSETADCDDAEAVVQAVNAEAKYLELCAVESARATVASKTIKGLLERGAVPEGRIAMEKALLSLYEDTITNIARALDVEVVA